jgi:hypothetical protein
MSPTRILDASTGRTRMMSPGVREGYILADMTLNCDHPQRLGTQIIIMRRKIIVTKESKLPLRINFSMSSISLF